MLQLPISTATTSCCSGSSWSWWSWVSLEQSPSSQWSGEQQQPLLPVAQTTAASDPCARPALPGGTAQARFFGKCEKVKEVELLQRLWWRKLLLQSNWMWNRRGKKPDLKGFFSLLWSTERGICVAKSLVLEMEGNAGIHVLNNSLLRCPFQNVIA